MAVCPFLGLISDGSLRLFNNIAPNIEIKRLLVPSVLNQSLLLIFGISLFFTNIAALWITMISIMISSSWIYVQEALSKKRMFARPKGASRSRRNLAHQSND